MTSDGRRGVTIDYNLMNFPEQIVAGSQKVTYIYSASGEKLATNANGSLTYYRSVMVYGNDNKLLYILTPEGTVTRNEGSSGTTYTYNYFKRDQVGSTRAVLSAVGTTLQNVQSTDYYPFGLAHSTNNLNKNKYLFSGKELQDSRAEANGGALGLYDFGSRQYDSFIGRWLKQDRYAARYASVSPYSYCLNNPIGITDPTGDTLKVHVGDETYIYASNGWGYGFFNTDGSEAKNLSSLALTMLWDLRTISSPFSPTGQAMTDAISTSEYTVTVERWSGGRNYFEPDNRLSMSYNVAEFRAGLASVGDLYLLDGLPHGSGGTIYYNPYNNRGGYNTRGDYNAPAYIGLAHEMGHAMDAVNGTMYYEDIGTYKASYLGLEKAEWQAVYIENQIRNELMLPLRTNYGIYEDTSDPTPPYLLGPTGNPLYYHGTPRIFTPPLFK